MVDLARDDGGGVVTDAPAGFALGSARSWRLRLVRAANLTLGTDPGLAEPYRARFEGAPPRVRVRSGVVTVEYGPRFRPGEWSRQSAEITLNPSVAWQIEGRKGFSRTRADLRGARLLALEVPDAAAETELWLGRPEGSVPLRFGGARDLTIRRPPGTAAMLQVAGGATGLTFEEQHYRAVKGESTWTSSGYQQATDRYEITIAHGVSKLVVGTLEPEAAAPARRLLATVLFTDIVGSTERAREVGDRRWREQLDAHDTAARRLVAEEGGRLVKHTGDGLLATFDGPGRAIGCALALRGELRAIGIEIRAGLHTGELEVRDGDVGGIAVHIAARVMAAAAPGEVLVSRTVRDLVAGSGITLEDRGPHTLKGLDDTWQLFAAG
jgi:class 3 adenylate cyclase